MIFHLKWTKPIKVAPQLSSLPVFMVNLTMIREIFRSMMEVELSDTDLLVIPLKNRYKKNELRYSCLTGTDQLMAGLLRYVRNFEIRLAFVTYYRDGYAIMTNPKENESNVTTMAIRNQNLNILKTSQRRDSSKRYELNNTRLKKSTN